ncbi:type I polyketide synthase [Aporhodopirellula aestuarii]|uniref:SDR family NAD(P)-dependent oxidoreductase n=1 Tax=Aporhodopirellula aestuarii TaxID=2950107 RepID=A0ABT0U8J2_9BACT|nr:type I polyketide synthase [Aporhodopirellula aestuarii]MCM2373287.1 SDR family NAD(P)-dependent oxidoreductase [Aporhodopirellula aestuarii]
MKKLFLPSNNTPSVVDLLRGWADVQPDDMLYRFLRAGEKGGSTFAPISDPQSLPESEGYTYGGMDRQARRIAVWLRDRVRCGECVVLAFPPGPEYLAAYFGCLYAGVIAVPAYPPRRNQRDERLRAIIADAEVKVGLTSASLVESIQAAETADEDQGKSGNWSVVTWHSIESMDPDSADDWVRPDLNRETTAFLQYTSGSTGSPKGVMVTHGNLLHNQHLIQSSFRSTHDDTLVGWLPLHHDMGLIGNSLHPLYLGGDLVFMSPIDFLQKPSRWLRAISQFHGTVAGGPNFAYRLCAEDIADDELEGIDLSCWRVAFNGAEPIDSRVLRQFANRFADYGFTHDQFCPCYGMAETTLLVSSSVREEPVRELPRHGTTDETDESRSHWVGCGVPDSSMDVRIVDPETKVEKAAGEIGEIWISGPSVAAGYWKNPQQSRETFAATIDGDDKSYLRTGDLGLIDNETFPGELFVTGRCKDLIIVHGVNHYPQDIERTAESAHPANATSGGAAFSINTDEGERLVIVQELRRSQRRDADPDEVIDAIRSAVMQEHQLVPLSILLLRPGGVPKTTSGKVQRSEARRRFENDEYRVMHRWDMPTMTETKSRSVLSNPTSPQTASIIAWLIEKIAARVKMPTNAIEVNEPVSRYGLDSVGAVRLAGELSEWLERDIPATLAYEYPTIASLAHHLSGEPDSLQTSPDARRRKETSKGRHSEQHAGSSGPVAIVGIGCRFPSAATPREFWNVLVAGADATGECSHRGDWPSVKNLDPSMPTRGGYLEDVAGFDAAFFGISPREADAIDPQHRLLLELTHEAFEDAGIPIASVSQHDQTVSGSERVGVFVGVGNNDYLQVSSSSAAGEVTAYTATGNSMAMAANRISYTFDFRGPSLTIDTACSSSLVATHQAVRALGAGDCDYAIAAGVNLILSTDATQSFTKAGMLSPSGVCRAFDEAADGFVRGEGGGAVLLRPLSDALADGNHIYAVIQGSAINQDGRSNGLTAPSRFAQAALIREALDDAGVRSDSIDYVEAHGTGTPLGDPIEARAICQALIETPRQTGEDNRTLKIGSVKTNIGHLEAAAGIAGLIKVALSVEQEVLPGQVNFSTPTPHIDWSTGLQVVTEPTPWPRSPERPRRAGISSFGFGGANAHLIIEEPPTVTNVGPETPSISPGVLVCSAKTPQSLSNMLSDIDATIGCHEFSSFAYTLAAGRSHYRHRAAWVGDASQYQTDGSANWIQGIAQRDASVDWYFSGQGGCNLGAGRKLYEENATFRHEFDLVNEAFAAQAGHDLKDRLWNTEEDWLNVWIQPALYCLQVAIARFWASLGVRPRRVVGHSLGEYAAACTAGVFEFEDGLTLVTRRAQLTGRLEQRGGMLAVFCDEANLRQSLAGFDGRCEIAAVNGPKQTVIASLPETLSSLTDYLKTQGIVSRPMSTTHGFHSWLIEPILDEFEQAVSMTAMMPPLIPFVSSQSGKLVANDVATPVYWRGNLRGAVRFDLVLNEMAAVENPSDDTAAAPTLGMEIGAGNTLSALARSAKVGLTVLPGWPAESDGSVKKSGSYWDTLANLYVYGVDFNWEAAFGGTAPIVSLPTYAFDRQRHWVNNRADASDHVGKKSPQGAMAWSAPESSTSTLGTRLDLASDDVVFETWFHADSYLADHRVGESVIFPAAGFMRWAIAAGEAILLDPKNRDEAGNHLIRLNDFEILRPMTFGEDSSKRCQLVLTQSSDSDSEWTGRIMSRTSSKWRLHATFSLFTARSTEPSRDASLRPDGDTATTTRCVETHYQQFEEAGMHYGPAFRLVEEIRSIGQVADAIVSTPRAGDPADSDHVGMLDACLQVVAACGTRWGDRAWVPVSSQSIEMDGNVFASAETGRVRVTARLVEHHDETAVADLVIEPEQPNDSANKTHLRIEGLRLRATKPIDTAELVLRDQWLPSIRDCEPPYVSAVPISLPIRRVESDGHDSRILRKISDALEDAAGGWTIKILSQLGIRWKHGDKFTLSSFAQASGVLPEHHRLLVRLLRIAEEMGFLESQPGSGEETWTVVACPASNLTDGPAHDHATNEFALLNRCAAATADLMRTGSDPLPLLFPSDGEISAADVYRDSVGGNRLNQLAFGVVSNVVAGLAPGRGLRILEIGAGTGATTRAVLDTLPSDRCEYVFTDVAPGFLAAARRQFADYDFVDFRVLDIERDPSTQGFEDSLQKFDIVIAANVLHATADLSVAMRNIRTLIHPQGQLVVLEGTEPARWLDLTFGLTPGWWRFTDTDLRPEYPLISPKSWARLLADTGFATTELIDPASGECDSKTSREIASPSKVIVAHAMPNQLTDDRRWLIVTDGSQDLSNSFADSLREQGSSVEIISDNDSASFSKRVNQACQTTHPTDVVVMLCDDAVADTNAVEELRRASENALAIFQALLGWQASDPTAVAGLRLRWVTRGALAIDSDSDMERCTDTSRPIDLIGGSLWGMWRTLTLEQPQWSCSGFDLDPSLDDKVNAALLLDEFSSTDPKNEEVSVRGNRRLVRQWIHQEIEDSDGNRARVLSVGERGTLDGLTTALQVRREPDADEIEIAPVASGLNFRDVLNVLGAYPGNPPLGGECAGVVVRVGADVDDFAVGDRVATIAADSIADYVTVPATSACRLPDSLSFTDAATIPIAFLTAATAIEKIADLQTGESILIHSAAGGVGMAAVQVARQYGATVFATASLEKHAVLRDLGVTHIFDSRSPGFADEITRLTAGRGVDVVLNSLGEDFIDENLNAISSKGRYVDIALANSAVTTRIATQKPHVRYEQLDLSQRLADAPALIGERLEQVMRRIESGNYQPLPLRAFAFDEAVEAMRWLQSGLNIGKAVIRCGVAEPNAPTPAAPATGKVSGLQIITGGLGGLGLLTAEYLIGQGATQIALLTRREASADETTLIDQWRKLGAEVWVERVQLDDAVSVASVLDRLRNRSGAITGIYHLAGVLDDAVMEQQTVESINRVLDAKVAGAWNLHLASQPDPIRDFVLYSSFSAWLGSPGQANHAIANAFLDSLAVHRRQTGLPALSIGWGPWGRIGAAANRDRLGRGDLAGIGMLMPDEGIKVLQRLQQSSALQESSGEQDPAAVAVVRLHLDRLPVHLQSHRLFAGLIDNLDRIEQTGGQHGYIEELKQLSAEERLKMVTQHIRDSIAASLALRGGDAVPLDQPLFDLGMDSLTSLELVNTLQSTLGVRISTIDLFNFPDVRALAGRMVELLSGDVAEIPYAEIQISENAAPVPELELEVKGSSFRANGSAASESSQISNGMADASQAETPDTEVSELLREIGDLSEQFERWGADQ